MLIAAVLLGALGASPAAGQGRDPTQVRVSDRTVVPGGGLRIQGQGWEPDTRVVFELNGQEFGETTTDVQGRFRAQLRIPDDLETGQHALTVIGQDQTGQELSLEETITVSAGAATEETSGWPVILAVVIGAVGVILIVAAILLMRRRPRGEELAGPSTQEPEPFEAGQKRSST